MINTEVNNKDHLVGRLTDVLKFNTRMSPALAAANWDKYLANDGILVWPPSRILMIGNQVLKIPFVGVWSPDSHPLSRLEAELYEAGGQGLDLLLQLAEVPLHILLHHHQTLSVAKLVSRHINCLSNVFTALATKQGRLGTWVRSVMS